MSEVFCLGGIFICYEMNEKFIEHSQCGFVDIHSFVTINGSKEVNVLLFNRHAGTLDNPSPCLIKHNLQ